MQKRVQDTGKVLETAR